MFPCAHSVDTTQDHRASEPGRPALQKTSSRRVVGSETFTKRAAVARTNRIFLSALGSRQGVVTICGAAITVNGLRPRKGGQGLTEVKGGDLLARALASARIPEPLTVRLLLTSVSPAMLRLQGPRMIVSAPHSSAPSPFEPVIRPLTPELIECAQLFYE